MSDNDKIKELNESVKVRIGVSKVDGVGVIAIRDIKKGEKIGCFPHKPPRFYNFSFQDLNKVDKDIRDIIIGRWSFWIDERKGFQHPNDDQCLIVFMNHSDFPNFNQLTDTAIKDIKRGEELLEDYRKSKN